jgi:hypothetical protein
MKTREGEISKHRREEEYELGKMKCGGRHFIDWSSNQRRDRILGLDYGPGLG